MAEMHPRPASFYQRAALLSQSFSPSSPINDAALFAGRFDERQDIVQAIVQSGQHVIIFGERGVGKTSLANILKDQFTGGSVVAVRVNCAASDDYTSVWRNVLAEIRVSLERGRVGFAGEPRIQKTDLAALHPGDRITPADVRKYLDAAGQGCILIVIIDEFDRLAASHAALFADTIKTLSDQFVPATLILVGVGSTVDQLIRDHASLERALVQVQMPRMSDHELREIIESGLARVRMTIEPPALRHIVRLSQGLPHYTHLLGLYSARAALERESEQVCGSDLRAAIKRSVEKAQASIKKLHYEATASPRRDSIYAMVLLASALARPDEMSYFAAADVRDSLQKITNKPYKIQAFSQHLNDFCDSSRGPLLEKTGLPRKFRFRFVNPLMQPYVIMHGLANGMIADPSLLDDTLTSDATS